MSDDKELTPWVYYHMTIELKEVRALLKLLSNEFIPYDDDGILVRKVIKRMDEFKEEHERA